MAGDVLMKQHGILLQRLDRLEQTMKMILEELRGCNHDKRKAEAGG